MIYKQIARYIDSDLTGKCREITMFPEKGWNREYLINYKGPGFLAVVKIWLFPLLSHMQVVSLSQAYCVSLLELITEEGRVWAKSFDGEKAWPSIKHAILSGLEDFVFHFKIT